MKEFWEKRYGQKEYVYGILPNGFFKEQISKLPPGNILLPAEGEGRNAVFAAKLGWQVTAFDISEVARQKAMKLAKSQRAIIAYQISSVLDFSADENFDAIGFIYAHFPFNIRQHAINKMLSLVKPGGKIIFEAFSKEQLGLESGGPKDEKMLFSLEEMKEEFKSLEFELLQKEDIILNEGQYHKGKASVIRMVGTKK